MKARRSRCWSSRLHRHGTPFDLLRAAYHLGNRHVPIELKPDHLQIEPDHVLAEMLRAHGPDVEARGGRSSRKAAPTTRRIVGHDHAHDHGACARRHACARSRPTRTRRHDGTRHDHDARSRAGHATTISDVSSPRRPARVGAPVAAPALLQLIWLASPSLPVGGFSYSEGLEAAIEAGLVGDEASAPAWLARPACISASRAPTCRSSRRRTPPGSATTSRASRELNDWVATTRETRELRLQTEQMGRSLSSGCASTTLDDARLRHPRRARAGAHLADRLRARRAPTPTRRAREVLLAFAVGWAENMTQAAMKAVPLGQIAGQRILPALSAAIPGAVDARARCRRRRACRPSRRCSPSSPPQHETQYSRLFRS